MIVLGHFWIRILHWNWFRWDRLYVKEFSQAAHILLCKLAQSSVESNFSQFSSERIQNILWSWKKWLWLLPPRNVFYTKSSHAETAKRTQFWPRPRKKDEAGNATREFQKLPKASKVLFVTLLLLGLQLKASLEATLGLSQHKYTTHGPIPYSLCSSVLLILS